MSIEVSGNREESAAGNQHSQEERVNRRNGVMVRSHSPASVELPAVEPWPEPVDGKELLDAIMRELQRFVVFPKGAAETFALWILHTFAFLLRDVIDIKGD